MSDEHSYYVYVYIDPRNFEEFYYGKGKGERKLMHLSEINDDSKKAEHIKNIRKAGLDPFNKSLSGKTKFNTSISGNRVWCQFCSVKSLVQIYRSFFRVNATFQSGRKLEWTYAKLYLVHLPGLNQRERGVI